MTIVATLKQQTVLSFTPWSPQRRYNTNNFVLMPATKLSIMLAMPVDLSGGWGADRGVKALRDPRLLAKKAAFWQALS